MDIQDLKQTIMDNLFCSCDELIHILCAKYPIDPHDIAIECTNNSTLFTIKLTDSIESIPITICRDTWIAYDKEDNDEDR